MNEATPTNPADGGSYVRDPETGALALREPTTAPPPGKSAQRREALRAAAPAAQQAETPTPAPARAPARPRARTEPTKPQQE